MNDTVMFPVDNPGLSAEQKMQPPVKRWDASSLAYKTVQRHRLTLEQESFVHVPASDMATLCNHASLTGIKAAADAAPPDPHSSGGRNRFYRTAEYQPWSRRFRFHDPFWSRGGWYVPYFQAEATNSDQGGKERRFAPLPDALEEDPLLIAAVSTIESWIPGEMIERRLPLRVGVHLIRLWSDGRRRALPSPPHLHTDGEPWTAIMLVDRENVTEDSARNFIAKRQCYGLHPRDIDPDDMIQEITMRTPLETILVDDARVSHHVCGVQGAHGQPGHRTSLLIDFSPSWPERTSSPKLKS